MSKPMDTLITSIFVFPEIVLKSLRAMHTELLDLSGLLLHKNPLCHLTSQTKTRSIVLKLVGNVKKKPLRQVNVKQLFGGFTMFLPEIVFLVVDD